jgi:release factor glutamine methyltransferase
MPLAPAVPAVPAVSAPWTIGRVRDWTSQHFATRGFAAARLEAELLVAHALGLRRLDLYLRFEQPLADAELAAVRALVERRQKHEPVAYILGVREFYGRAFAVDRRVLIPRPETEDVVTAVLAQLAETPVGAAPRVLDVGTGSGAIAVSVAAERTDAVVDAVDISADAADVARANAARHGVADRVTVHVGSVYAPVAGERYAVIASNPPYIARGEIPGLMPDVARYEPHLALDGGASGVELVAAVVEGARTHLAPGGGLVVEIGFDQGPRARALAEAAGLVGVEVRRDLAGHDRVLVARAP